MWDDPDEFEIDEYDEYSEIDALLEEDAETIRAAEAAMRLRPSGLPDDMMDADDRIWA